MEASVHRGNSPQRTQSMDVTVQRPLSMEASVHICDGPWKPLSTEASVHRGRSPRM